MNKRKIFWHEAHFEALKLELHQYRDALSFITEHQLSKKALIMDVLIIKKDPNTVITKNIGRIFSTHNVVEFKSEKDSLSIYDYNKVLAYALLYSSFERIPISNITVTFSLTVRPRELLKHLKNERQLHLFGASDGITYIKDEILPVQILESKKLPDDENLFIKGLRRGNNAVEISKILKKFDNLVGMDTRNVYIDRLIRANENTFKEVSSMSEELKRIWGEIANENGWLAERDAALIAETASITARETAKKLLDFGDPVDKIAFATNLPVEEVMELA